MRLLSLLTILVSSIWYYTVPWFLPLTSRSSKAIDVSTRKFTVWLHGVVTSIGHNRNRFDKTAREDDYFKGMTVEGKLAASTC